MRTEGQHDGFERIIWQEEAGLEMCGKRRRRNGRQRSPRELDRFQSKRDPRQTKRKGVLSPLKCRLESHNPLRDNGL
jgi:hypothetical protein